MAFPLGAQQPPTTIAPTEPEPVAPAEEKLAPKMTPQELLTLTRTYFNEADEARRPVIEQWERNWNAFHAIYDYTNKAEWQSTQRLPEVSNFVERLVAAMRDALLQSPDWLEMEDPTEQAEALLMPITKLVQAFIDRSGTNRTGHPVSFDHTFASIVKSGALMMMAASVTWDHENERLKIENVDARELYFDPTGRNLYRIRRRELDRHQFNSLKNELDSNGKPVYDVAAIDRVVSSALVEEDRLAREVAAQHGKETDSGRRRQVVLDEYRCTLINASGELVGKNQLLVIANDQEIVRGPEDNPFWHGQDWIVAAPLLDLPFSQYGRTYVEQIEQLAMTFIELTNLMLDATFTSAINANMLWPDALDDPTEAADGVHPGKTFLADEDWPAGAKFIQSVELGRLYPESFQMWSGIKQEMREGANQNELALGQLPPKGDITATEINTASQGGAVMVKGMASDIDSQLLSVIGQLAYGTVLQHLRPDSEMARELDGPMLQAILARRGEFRNRKFRFRASALSGRDLEGEKLRGLLGALNVVGGNPLLAQAFAQAASVPKLMQTLFQLLGVDFSKIQKDRAEQLQAQLEAREAAAREAGGVPGAPGNAITPELPSPPGGTVPGLEGL